MKEMIIISNHPYHTGSVAAAYESMMVFMAASVIQMASIKDDP
jgi:hypothetical protein